MQFYSLTKELKGLHGKQLNELPETLRDYIKSEVLPNLMNITSWDTLSPDERHSAAMVWDYQQDPSTKRDIEYWGNFTQRMEKIRGEIREWETVPAPTASDLQLKKAKLGELHRQLAKLEHKQQNARVDHPFQDDLSVEIASLFGNPDYVPYPIAYKLLSDRLSATPEEIAAWIHQGPNEGGLAAYIGVKELTCPLRFYFDYCKGDSDYLSHLMACWFRATDIEKYQPSERFITGQQLKEYWDKQSGIQLESFIMAKISEGRLVNYQPVMEWLPSDKNENFRNIDTALFLWTDIENIDTEDFGVGNNPLDTSWLNDNNYPANVLPYVIEKVKLQVEDTITYLKSYSLTQQGTTSKQADLVNNKLIEMEEILSLISNLNNPSSKEKISDLLEVQTFSATNTMPCVSASEIRMKFTVFKSEEENRVWWVNMMRNASDNGLTMCRVGSGKKGPGGSLWRPDLIAGWLVERHNKEFNGLRKLDGMSKNAVRIALVKFTGYEEIAECFFYTDE